ncbi:MAG: hypothetical protein JXR76_07320 [Deltaproteobacteria bacterium]|nr:hypothetical protein [Deltaproteobacteria bacterium]
MRVKENHALADALPAQMDVPHLKSAQHTANAHRVQMDFVSSATTRTVLNPESASIWDAVPLEKFAGQMAVVPALPPASNRPISIRQMNPLHPLPFRWE